MLNICSLKFPPTRPSNPLICMCLFSRLADWTRPQHENSIRRRINAATPRYAYWTQTQWKIQLQSNWYVHLYQTCRKPTTTANSRHTRNSWGCTAQLALTKTVAQWECDQRPEISNISRGIFSTHSAAAVIGAIEKPSATAPGRQGNAINIGLRNTF